MGDADLHPPVEPMKVTSVAEWPPGPDSRYEMKLDGWRRQILEDLLIDSPTAIPLCPHTADLDQAQEWMAEGLEGIGIEGAVIKRARSRYRPGGTGWLKRRVTQTLDLVVGGVTGTLDRPHSLLRGRQVGTRLSYVGQTTALSAPAGAEVAQMFGLRRITEDAPSWPWPLPARWVGFHMDKPLAYLPVTPRLTVEVLADTAFEYGRYRHPLRFLRIRPDVT